MDDDAYIPHTFRIPEFELEKRRIRYNSLSLSDGSRMEKKLSFSADDLTVFQTTRGEEHRILRVGYSFGLLLNILSRG